MAFCPRCGAASTPGMAFCTACGENLPAVPSAPAQPGAATPLDPYHAWRSRPVGKRVRPVVVVLLALVTITIYAYVFWWRTTRETDAYAGSSSHGPARAGVLVLVTGLLVTIGTGFAVVGAYDWTAIAEERIAAPTPEQIRADVRAHPGYLGGALLNAVGMGILLVGLWRMWSAIRDDEARRGRRDPFDPRLAAGIVGASIAVSLVSYLVPMPASISGFVGLFGLVVLIAMFVLYYQTQARLNEMWDAAAAGPSAPPVSAP